MRVDWETSIRIRIQISAVYIDRGRRIVVGLQVWVIVFNAFAGSMQATRKPREDAHNEDER